MTKDETFDAVVAQRHRLLATLDGLGPDEWDALSLCDGWRVREVIGHLVSILELPTRAFLLGALRARSFDRFADATARRFGERAPADLVRAYRERASTRFAPPMMGPIAPLTDVYVHTRDVERPLGRPSTLDPAGLRRVLAFLAGGRATGFVPRSRTAGLGFEATDLGWSTGGGPTVAGSGEALVLALTGRRVALADLSGDGVAALRSRLA